MSPSEERSSGRASPDWDPQLVVRVPVRRADLDVLGHVNQAVFHEFIEEARATLLERSVDPRGFVLARIELDYRAEIGQGVREVDVAAGLIDIGRSSLRIGHEIRLPSKRVAASGTSILVAWDLHGREKRELSEEERQRLWAPGQGA